MNTPWWIWVLLGLFLLIAIMDIFLLFLVSLKI